MAKWFKDYLSFGSRRSPPQPPKPDYTESDILKAYRAQKSLDFEDPYEDGDGKTDPDIGGTPNKGCGGCGGNLEGKYGSPKHRLIKVDASDLNRSKALLATAGEDSASEYSDPFDAHREPKGDTEEDAGLENNGYMEPYNAQRVKSRIGLQLYDTPYEEKEAETDPEAGPTEKPPKSRLPQEDERPADEYDQPWEWKKNHISRAFAAQFEAPEWDRTSPSSSSSSSSAPKEHWPHPPKHLKSSQSFMHMKFTRTKDNRYILGQNSAPFESIPEVIHHYTTRELPVKGAEHFSLLYPVAVQTA
uniref:Src homology 2 domain containing transforming protein D n=1 Tax=Pseudonaja textilis TaxID=8673 RepID=A0A670YQQ6_PSETE